MYWWENVKSSSLTQTWYSQSIIIITRSQVSSFEKLELDSIQILKLQKLELDSIKFLTFKNTQA